MPNNDKYPFPVNEWIDEQIPVRKNSFIPNDPNNAEKGGKIVSTTEYQTQRTKYIEATPERIRCRRGTHVFDVLDNKKWLFGCQKCTLEMKIMPTAYKFVDGALINKKTSRRV